MRLLAGAWRVDHIERYVNFNGGFAVAGHRGIGVSYRHRLGGVRAGAPVRKICQFLGMLPLFVPIFDSLFRKDHISMVRIVRLRAGNHPPTIAASLFGYNHRPSVKSSVTRHTPRFSDCNRLIKWRDT